MSMKWIFSSMLLNFYRSIAQKQKQTQLSSNTHIPPGTLDAADFPITAPVAVTFGVDTVFVASVGVTVALPIDGYADCVGNVTPLNASTMNVTELFMYGVPERMPYDRCGKNDVPFPHICL
jgi:hypothetical protein